MTKRLTRISYFTMLMIVAGLIKIRLPSFPVVDYSFQCVVAVVAGLILGAKDGAISLCIYLVLGIIGLPIFVNGGGYRYVLDPTFGYVLSFPFGAFLSGFLKGRFKTLSIIKLFFCAFFAVILIYFIGMTYQFISLITFLDEGLSYSLNSLAPLPFYAIIDSIILYLICFIYPKMLTVIGEKKPFEQNQQNKTHVKSDKNP